MTRRAGTPHRRDGRSEGEQAGIYARRPMSSYWLQMDAFERRLLVQAIEAAEGVMTRAAELLGVHVKFLERRRKALGLAPPSTTHAIKMAKARAGKASKRAVANATPDAETRAASRPDTDAATRAARSTTPEGEPRATLQATTDGSTRAVMLTPPDEHSRAVSSAPSEPRTRAAIHPPPDEGVRASDPAAPAQPTRAMVTPSTAAGTRAESPATLDPDERAAITATPARQARTSIPETDLSTGLAQSVEPVDKY